MNIDRIKQETQVEKISYFQSIDSTNSYLLEQGECGEICISDTQSAGRGRRGNVWVSPNTGNLYFSLCWCFEKIPEYWSLLGLLVGVVIAETLEDIGLKNHGVKWPNDIFWQQQKMGGILIETLNQSGKVVIGIGLNLEMARTDKEQIDQAVVSLNEALADKGLVNKTFVKDDLIITLINKLYQNLQSFKDLKFDRFISSWNNWDILYNEIVTIKRQGSDGGDIIGQVKGIDNLGRLKFKEQDSDNMLFFTSADIKLKSLNKK